MTAKEMRSICATNVCVNAGVAASAFVERKIPPSFPAAVPKTPTTIVLGSPLTKTMSVIERLPVGGESKLAPVETASFWNVTLAATAVAFVDR